MSVSWTLNSTIFAEFDFRALQGSPGLGFYRLIAQVDVTTHSKQAGEEVAVTNIGSELYVRGKGNQSHFFGYLRQQSVKTLILTSPHTQKTNLTLDIELDGSRIEAIERVRLGESLFFEMNLYGVADSGSVQSLRPVYATLTYRANQSTWMEILEQMGYRKTILLEIPVPGDGASPQLPEAAKYLQTAQTHMLRGHFRDAVGACRDVMESLSSALNDERAQPPEAIKSWFEGTRSLDKEERLRIVRRALKILTHPARHVDEVSASIEWGPTDARSAIIIAAALLDLAGRKR